jgi:hypothetical protein
MHDQHIRWKADITDGLAEGRESVSFTFTDFEQFSAFALEMGEWLEFHGLTVATRAEGEGYDQTVEVIVSRHGGN